MPPSNLSRLAALAAALALAGAGGLSFAQGSDSGRGVAPIDSSGSFEVSGIDVDVTAKTAEAARLGGWRIAQRNGWAMLSKRLGAGPGSLSDGALDSIISGIVVENEQLGPNRYVARLGILFNRTRAGSILGVSYQSTRSAPMLVLPLQYSGGVGQVFEERTAWQEAWARFRTGNSTVDYVRPSGTGPDALLMNAGQVSRPGRGWWRAIVQQYGASDILIPTVRLYRQWPGGPVIGAFQARYGPDNRLIDQFTLRVGNADALPVLLDAGVKRIDDLYQRALGAGVFRTDPTLLYVPAAAVAPVTVVETPDAAAAAATAAAAGSEGQVVNIQYETPSAGTVSSTEAVMRGVPGVRSAITTSLALGGVSVMRVGYDGDPAGLRAQLEKRGWLVSGGGTTFRIRRAPPSIAPPIATPSLPSGDNVAGG